MKKSDKEKYDVILNRNIEAMLKYIVNDDRVDFHDADLSKYARNDLLNAGMSEKEINSFIDKLTK